MLYSSLTKHFLHHGRELRAYSAVLSVKKKETTHLSVLCVHPGKQLGVGKLQKACLLDVGQLVGGKQQHFGIS